MSLALIASLVSSVFGAVVCARWVGSHRGAFGAWTVGLFVFALAAAFQAVGEARGFTDFTFRAFYLLGGVLGVAYLALGTVFLMAPRRVAWAATAVLVVVSVASTVSAATVAVDPAKLSSASGILGEAIQKGTLLHAAAVILNIVGSLALIGGSAWSAWRFIRGHAPLDRVVCNVLLTAGAFVIAAGFSAAKVAGGSLDTLGGYEAAGITVMFLGFLSLGRLGRRAGQPATLPAAKPAEGAH